MRPITKNPPKSAKITANAAMNTVTARLVGGEASFLDELDVAAALEEVGELMMAVNESFSAGGDGILSCLFP